MIFRTRFWRQRIPLPRRAFLVAVCGIAWAGASLPGAAPDDAATENPAELIAQLDDARFEVRERAAARLSEMAEQPKSQGQLAAAIQAALLHSETSFEVRSQLEPLLKKLPESSLPAPLEVSPEELDRLVAQLDAAKYSERLGAAARLKWLATRPSIACQVMTRLKGFQSNPKVSAEVRKGLQPIWDAARRVWLTSDPKSWNLPSVSAAEISDWLDDVTAAPLPEDALPSARKAQFVRQEAAKQELLDLLARDDYLPQVKTAIEKLARSAEIDPAARGRLDEILDWTRPAMVAEFWEEKHHLGIQKLFVGEPSQSRGADRPSYFDRIDDQTAHCVSGNSLKPGDYPVGVLFPHPNAFKSGAQFHLVNLPMPRRRMAYEYDSKRDEAQRLAELSERTLNAIAAQKRPLKEAELIMLQHLDASAVSRFTGPYFAAFGDPVPADRAEENRLGRGSEFTNVCNVLVEVGTPEALPGLLAAIDAKRFPAPAAEAPENWPWIAALAIAERDDGPKSDAWLASLIERTDPLRIVAGEKPPELGATAAAILAARRKAPLSEFGLESAEDPMLAEFGAPGYRFIAPAGRKKVLKWWAEQKPPVAQRAAAVQSR